MGISGISTGFPVLSRSSGQVAHVLLTRSPLGLHRCCHRLDPVRLACIKHAASVRPEPGSNSPSRLLRWHEGHRKESESRSDGLFIATDNRPRGALRRAFQGGLPLLRYIDVRPRDVVPEPPALAFGSRSSVFKERPGTHPRALVPGLEAAPRRNTDGWSLPRRAAPTGPVRRELNCTRRTPDRQPVAPCPHAPDTALGRLRGGH